MLSVENIGQYELRLTRHALKMAVAKGFSEDMLRKTFAEPKQVYPSHSHPGQFRVTGNGICLVGAPVVVEARSKTFCVITVYADRILTPPRADQLDSEAGKRYAERYARGLGRG